MPSTDGIEALPEARNGWHDLCQDCWQAIHTTEYLPEQARDYAICEQCGDNTLVYGHRGTITIKVPHSGAGQEYFA